MMNFAASIECFPLCSDGGQQQIGIFEGLATRNALAAPFNAAAPKPEMRAAILFAPHGGMQPCRAIIMPRHVPAWTLIGQ
jgi:hypothetical protein